MKPILTIRWKLTIAYAALIVAVVVGRSMIDYRIVGMRLQSSISKNLNQYAQGLWRRISFQGDHPKLQMDGEDYFVHMAARYYQLYDAGSGELLAQSEESRLLKLAVPPEIARKLTSREIEEEVDTTTGARVDFRSYVFQSPGGHDYLLRVGISVMEAWSLRQQALQTTLITLPFILALAAVGTWWAASTLLRPIEDLREAAHRIGISQLNLRLPLRGSGDELDKLAITFNEVFARLEGAVQDMKQFTASISHELRTPLAVLQGETETALMEPELTENCRHVLASQLEEFEKLSRLVNSLLELARAEAGEIQLSKKEFDVAAMVRELAETMHPIAASAEVDLVTPAGEPVRIVGDRQWIERVVINLIDNALKFTPAGASVTVTTRLVNGSAEIQVSDTGIGIAKEILPHIFTRFYQADTSRSRQKEGIGLGLAIASWIVNAHHGSIKVSSEPGAGTCFTVLLPA